MELVNARNMGNKVLGDNNGEVYSVPLWLTRMLIKKSPEMYVYSILIPC